MIWIVLFSLVLVWIYNVLGWLGCNLLVVVKFVWGFGVVVVGFFMYGIGVIWVVNG